MPHLAMMVPAGVMLWIVQWYRNRTNPAVFVIRVFIHLLATVKWLTIAAKHVYDLRSRYHECFSDVVRSL